MNQNHPDSPSDRSALSGSALEAVSPERLRALGRLSVSGVALFDEDRFHFVSAPFCYQTGYTEAELLELPPSEVFAGNTFPLSSGDDELLHIVVRHRSGLPRALTARVQRVLWHGSSTLLASTVDLSPPIPSKPHDPSATTSLQISQEWLQLAQRAGRSLVWDWDVDSDAMYLSDSAVEIFGFTRERIPRSGEELMTYIPPSDQALIHEALRNTLRTAQPYLVEHRVDLPIGIRWLAVRGQLFPGEVGPRILGVSTDITEHRRAEEDLEREQTRAQVTLEAIGDGVIRTDAEGRVDYMNPVAEALTGYRSEQAEGLPLGQVYRIIDENDRLTRADPVQLCLATDRVVVLPGAAVLLSSDGSEHAIRDSAAPIRNAQGEVNGAVLVTQDISELRTLEREMTFLAQHDPLTGLINRREFERELAATIMDAHRQGRRHALCYLDLDEFKVVNDTCGHVAGDELLRQLTAVLDAAVRDSDVLARLGGDEFGVLLRDCDSEAAVSVAEKLCATVRQFRFTWETRLFNIGVSIGIVPIASVSGSLDQLLSAADAACYVAKEHGRGRVHLYQPDDEALAQRYGEMQWVERIHQAFDEGRFRLYHQPIVAIPPAPAELATDHRVVDSMAEILLRMLDDHGKPITASAFIAAAERYHLIGAIDRWVVEHAVAALSRDRSNTVFTLNLSGHSLGDSNFLSFVETALDRGNVDPTRLCFEVTETAAITNLSGARRLIGALRERGCRFVLDDFGTGLSSFAYLRSLEVDYLKIDGEFVRHMMNDPVERALVGSIDQIGHLLGLSTIAESVEDAETLAALRELGVDYAQGYFIGEPQPWPAADTRAAADAEAEAEDSDPASER